MRTFASSTFVHLSTTTYQAFTTGAITFPTFFRLGELHCIKDCINWNRQAKFLYSSCGSTSIREVNYVTFRTSLERLWLQQTERVHHIRTEETFDHRSKDQFRWYSCQPVVTPICLCNSIGDRDKHGAEVANRKEGPGLLEVRKFVNAYF
jgi:hypothetical protein